MKIPRNLSGEDLANRLKKYGYLQTRQTGSHLRVTTTSKGEHHITIPKHKSLRVGTVNSILIDISNHLKISKKSIIEDLFS